MEDFKGYKILAVDDEFHNRAILRRFLEPEGYILDEAGDGEEAITKVAEFHPDIILLDCVMPKKDGYQVAKELKESPETKNIPIIMITALNGNEDLLNAYESGVDDFLNKPYDQCILKARVRSLLKVKLYNDNILEYNHKLEQQVEEQTQIIKDALNKLEHISLEVIFRLSRAAEFKDDDTAVHIKRMSVYSERIAIALGMDKTHSQEIRYAAPMHDIGKIGIPDEILLKPGKLEPEEWEIMKTHAIIGAEILKTSEFDIIQLGETIAMNHHERWDGTGYPNGLKGDEIPIEARIVAVADVFDALTSDRPYKKAFSIEKSIEIIKELSGTHFDPNVVNAFLRVMNEIIEIKNQFMHDSDINVQHINLKHIGA